MEDTLEYYEYKKTDLVDKPLWYHKQGLMQTASGYGSRLVTSRMLKIGKRLHRIYCMCYGNSGSIYIILKGKQIFLHDWAIDD
jgi:hypothetical protein